MASRRRRSRLKSAARETAQAKFVERRVGPSDRRAVPRGTDRRVGPRTAARMAKARLDGDVEFLKKSVVRGEWMEVAKVATGLAGEVASFLYSGILWPLALMGKDLPDALTELEDLDDVEEPPADAARPVILVHGWLHNRTGCRIMAKRFREAGRKHVFAIDLPTATATVPRMAEILDDKVAKIRELTRARHVDVVGHSLGGLVARWWMTHAGGGKVLRNLVTLGAPHKGTALAAFVPLGAGKAINIGSEVVRSLDVPPPPNVRVTAIWSDMDYLILPPEMEKPGPGNVRVRYVGHLSLLYSKAVFRHVEKALRATGERTEKKAR